MFTAVVAARALLTGGCAACRRGEHPRDGRDTDPGREFRREGRRSGQKLLRASRHRCRRRRRRAARRRRLVSRDARHARATAPRGRGLPPGTARAVRPSPPSRPTAGDRAARAEGPSRVNARPRTAACGAPRRPRPTMQAPPPSPPPPRRPVRLAHAGSLDNMRNETRKSQVPRYPINRDREMVC